MDATSPIALLAVERDDYLPLNAATVNILTNIMGMMTSRNRCEEVAASGQQARPGLIAHLGRPRLHRLAPDASKGAIQSGERRETCHK